MVVTILDFRGRVLKSFQRAVPADLPSAAHGELANRWHAETEAEIRSMLTSRSGPSEGVKAVVARFFVEALIAYQQMDRDSTHALLRACDALLPGDPWIGNALATLNPPEPHQ
ncbi:hypothetical protein ACNOYE_13325 [Nannocystaceae bacterium ST9]